MTRRGTTETRQIHRIKADGVITRTTAKTVNGVTKTKTVKLTKDEKAKFIRDNEKQARDEAKRGKHYDAELDKTKAIFAQHGIDVSHMTPAFGDVAAKHWETIVNAKKTAPGAAPNQTNAQKSANHEKKQKTSKPKVTKLKKHEKGTTDTKPTKKLNGYSLFLREYQPTTTRHVDKIDGWNNLTRDQKGTYTKKADAWNKKHQLADYATTNNPATKGKKVTQINTTIKLKANVFDEIIQSIDDAFERKNTAMDKMFKSITLKQSNFPSIKIDKNLQDLFNVIIFAAESIYEKAAGTDRR